jgi:hypothetical protein
MRRLLVLVVLLRVVVVLALRARLAGPPGRRRGGVHARVKVHLQRERAVVSG